MAEEVKMSAAHDYAAAGGKVLDAENAPSRVNSNTIAISDETAHVVDRDAEKKLCRKFDFRLLPVLAIMVCCGTFEPANNLLNCGTVSLQRARQVQFGKRKDGWSSGQ